MDLFRRLLRTLIEGNYTVEDFDNPVNLLGFLEETPCDLIVSGLSLPGMGFDFITALRKNARFRSIPVVAYTGDASVEISKATLAAGFVDCLEKRGPLKRLMAVIARYL